AVETARNLEVLKVRMQLGLITPLEEAEARAAEAARALESGFRAMQQAAATVGQRRAEEVFGPQLASLMAQVAATKRVADAQKAAAEARKKSEEEAKSAAEANAKLEEDRATRSAEGLESLLDGLNQEIERIDDVRSLDEVEVKIKEKNRALQDLINAGRLTEFEIAQARNGIDFLQSKLREEGFQRIIDEVAERRRSLEAGGQELSQREQVIRLQGEVLEKFRGTADQAERIRAAFSGLYGAALKRDQEVALKRFDEFTKNLDEQLRATKDIGEAEKVRLQIDDLIAEKNKLIKDGLVDQKRENEANAKIEEIRLGLIQKATRETGAEIDAFVQMQKAQREQTDNVGRAAELRKKALERFGVGSVGDLPIEVQVKLDAASVEEARGKFDQAFSKPFAATFSEAIRSSILGGQDAMQTLAQFGQGLFDDWIGEVTRQLQEGVSNALTQALGSGGQALGGALQGALGIAGLFLSKGAGSTSSRFGSVQSGVTASQAVRGIVSGPESVAVASVGDNMQRAIVPVVLRLDSIIGILTDIRGGRSAAQSFAYAGTVPTQ
ncbi:MAG: hypothetical protein LLG93_08895, partial [Deltaproteobacteria bacterium]|nr:hypothetical protein [Deltaproteobacteria bacterium]